jgi:hypothetical protein
VGLTYVGVKKTADELAAVDMEQVKLGKISMDDVRKLAPDFEALFGVLLSLMTIQGKKERAKREKEQNKQTSAVLPPTTAAVKRQAQEDLDVTAKRVRLSSTAALPAGPTTPDQPTRPSDPKYSLGTDSNTSQDEEGTRTLLFLMLSRIMSVLQKEFRRIMWLQSPCVVEICQTYYCYKWS